MFNKFGGDPDRVVIVGDSSGAGSIALHLVANGGAPTNLFAGAFGVSPFFPTQRRVPELEWQFDLFASRAGCGSSTDPLNCLRQKNSTELQLANQNMTYPGRQSYALWPYTPTIDGDLIPDFPYRLLEQGKFVKVPCVFGYAMSFILTKYSHVLTFVSDDTNEGTIFAANAKSLEEVGSFMKDNFPQLSDEHTAAISAIYSSEDPFSQHAAYFSSAAAAYGESTFVCPGLELSTLVSQHTKSWNYR